MLLYKEADRTLHLLIQLSINKDLMNSKLFKCYDITQEVNRTNKISLDWSRNTNNSLAYVVFSHYVLQELRAVTALVNCICLKYYNRTPEDQQTSASIYLNDKHPLIACISILTGRKCQKSVTI